MQGRLNLNRFACSSTALLLSFLLTACGGGGGGNAAVGSGAVGSSGGTGGTAPTVPIITNYTVAVTAGSGGSSTTTSLTVAQGATTNVTFTPTTGYRLSNVSGCNGTLNGTTYTTAAVTANCTVNATFALINDQKITGKVIDGYVTGATVWLDINGNALKDADEPATISKDLGDYSLELSSAQLECAAYSTLYVDVPVGAVDADSGPVTEAYQMARPPLFKPLTNNDVLHISPLTTVLSEQIIAKLSVQSGNANSCESLKANQSLRQNLRNELENLIVSMVKKHNISAEKIFADFIQNKDAESHKLALSIVKGLQASFAYRDTLKKQYPTATYIRTLFYQGSELDNKNAYPQAWYRDSDIWLPTGFVSELVKMQDDLKEVKRIVFLRETKEFGWNNATFSYKQDVWNDLGDTNTTYRCEGAEYLKLKSITGVIYTYSNSASSDKVTDPKTCQASNFDNTTTKYYEADYSRDGVNYYARFDLKPTDPEFNELKDWVNLQDKADKLNVLVLYERLSKIGYLFDEEPKITSSFWHKRSTDDRTPNRVQIDKYSDGTWTRQTTRDDKTILKEYSKDGITWTKGVGSE